MICAHYASTNSYEFVSFSCPGNQHFKEVAVCDCKGHAVTFVRCQFWPGSPERPSVSFHFKLMDLAEKLFLHGQVSVKVFSELLQEMIPPMQPTFVSNLYTYYFFSWFLWLYNIDFVCLRSIQWEKTKQKSSKLKL